MRRDFVTNLSHEIKTPLAVIRGAAETLQESADDPDLLTLARLESPEASLQRQPVDLAAICRRSLEVLAPVAERASVTLRSSIEGVPALDGDARALERLVLNLVVNAIQYNREGGHVTLRLAPAGGASASGDPSNRPSVDRIVLEVEDDGIGIPAAELDRIFERFYRVDKGRGRREGGSGLGLAIVKHVAQSHGGSVEVQSQVDRGSRFRVTLPVGAAAAAVVPMSSARYRHCPHCPANG